ncbi:hypothetical protein K523DRAFT_341615 [Schizophyllum commune Tattone D]|nr:hypothetical protein K523DRAFT_341615 [Schizophyllum commune Tattone D]
MEFSVTRLPIFLYHCISAALFGVPAENIAIQDPAPVKPPAIYRLSVETLHEIAEHVGHNSKADLASLVRVDQRFQALGEGILWRELPSIVPLLRLLMPEYFYLNYVYVRQHKPLPDDVWEQHPNLLRLASHVKTLLIHPISCPALDHYFDTFWRQGTILVDMHILSEVSRSLSSGPSRTALFPRLQRLEVNSFSGISAQLLLPLLGANLSSCVAYCTIWGLDELLTRTKINNFSHCEFMLSDLLDEFLNDNDTSDDEDDDPEPFRPDSVVERRSVFDMINLRDIAPVIHSLRVLKLRLNFAKDLPTLLRPASDSLRSLDVEISELEDTETDYNLRSLRSLTVRRQKAKFARALSLEIAGSDDLDALLARIRQECRPATLRRVRIDECEGSTQDWSFTVDQLTPLRAFPCLVELNISVSSEISMTDADYGALAPSWPSLRVFKLKHARDALDTAVLSPSTTLAALVSFATACPDLEELGIQLHVNSLPDLVLPAHQSRVHTLDLGIRTTLGVDVPLVADFLRSLFPALQKLHVVPALGVATMWNRVRYSVLPPYYGASAPWLSAGN